MVQIQGHEETIRGAKLSPRYQRYFDKCNRYYFEGKLPDVRIYVAPLLKVSQLTQESAKDSENWKHAGNYAICGYDEDDKPCIVLDKGTSIFHSILTKQSILHEQIHFYIGLDIQTHGKQFKAQIRRIAALGALDELI
jgi:hypothetical protein